MGADEGAVRETRWRSRDGDGMEPVATTAAGASHGRKAKRPSALRTCVASAVLCAVLLTVVLKLYQADLSVPLMYLGDAVVFLARAKAILQGDWIRHNTRLGMPFGADYRDFPLN